MDQSLVTQIIFYAFAAMTIVSAGFVVFSKNLTHSAFALLFTFFGVAGLYVFLGADFLAATQMIIYVGGILVLLLFGVMLTHKLYSLDLKSETFQVRPALLIVAAIFITLVVLIARTSWHNGGEAPMDPTTAAIGQLFMTDYILPFEVSSILLLIALIGAAMIVRRRKE